MRQMMLGVGTVVVAMLMAGTASAQQAVKIGVVMSYSGQFADPGAQIDNGIKLYMKEHGDTVAGRKIEIIRKDSRRHRARRRQAPFAESDRSRRRRYPRRVRPNPQRARGRRCFRAGQNIHGRHECRDRDHHHQNRPIWCAPRLPCRRSTSRSAPGPGSGSAVKTERCRMAQATAPILDSTQRDLPTRVNNVGSLRHDRPADLIPANQISCNPALRRGTVCNSIY